MRNLSALAILLSLSCAVLSAADARNFTAEQLRQAIEALPKTPPTNREVLAENHYAIKVAVIDHRSGPGEVHETEDRVFYVLEGSSELRVGGSLDHPRRIAPAEVQGTTLKGARTIQLAPGSVVSVPRGTPYQFAAPASRISFLVVRIEGR